MFLHNGVNVLQQRQDVVEYELKSRRGIRCRGPAQQGFFTRPAAERNRIVAGRSDDERQSVVSQCGRGEGKQGYGSVVVLGISGSTAFRESLGLVAAGLLQIIVWMLMVGLVPLITMLLLHQQFEVQIHLGQLFLGGFL